MTAPVLIELLPYPANPPAGAASRRLTVQVDCRRPGGIALRYELSGDLADVIVPAPQPAGRRDGLWHHTCFEAFVATTADPDGPYLEFNFSPSAEWAAYGFERYRQGMQPLAVAAEPAIRVSRDAGRVVLEAWACVPPSRGAAIGLCAVVESAHQGRQYWALLHPAGKPDFHQRDGFALRLDSGNANRGSS